MKLGKTFHLVEVDMKDNGRNAVHHLPLIMVIEAGFNCFAMLYLSISVKNGRAMN